MLPLQTLLKLNLVFSFLTLFLNIEHSILTAKCFLVIDFFTHVYGKFLDLPLTINFSCSLSGIEETAHSLF